MEMGFIKYKTFRGCKKIRWQRIPKEIITETWTLEYNADKANFDRIKTGKTTDLE